MKQFVQGFLVATVIWSIVLYAQSSGYFGLFGDSEDELLTGDNGLDGGIEEQADKGVRKNKRRGKKRGGWQKLKDNGELEALKSAGSLLDLLRYNSGGDAENGYVLESRHMNDGMAVEAEGSLNGDVWTVVLVRPLKSEQPGDLSIEAGKTYTVGFAIHDDYTDARFHHVSLEFHLGLDNAEADINVAKQ